LARPDRPRTSRTHVWDPSRERAGDYRPPPLPISGFGAIAEPNHAALQSTSVLTSVIEVIAADTPASLSLAGEAARFNASARSTDWFDTCCARAARFTVAHDGRRGDPWPHNHTESGECPWNSDIGGIRLLCSRSCVSQTPVRIIMKIPSVLLAAFAALFNFCCGSVGANQIRHLIAAKASPATFPASRGVNVGKSYGVCDPQQLPTPQEPSCPSLLSFRSRTGLAG
jgi:hypothetical protein